MANKALVATKVGMTQQWDEQGRIVPVTVLRVDDCRVVQVKTTHSDGYRAVQVTYGERSPQKLSRPQAGHFESAGVEPGRRLLEFRVDEVDDLTPGTKLEPSMFEPGELVDVTAVSKGKGFAGVMKRHNFAGQRATHGAHLVHRAPGSIGACATPSRVFKGMKMAGRMGGAKVTTLNLTVVSVSEDGDLMLLKGSVPGPKGGTVIIRNAVKAPVAVSA